MLLIYLPRNVCKHALANVLLGIGKTNVMENQYKIHYETRLEMRLNVRACANVARAQ